MSETTTTIIIIIIIIIIITIILSNFFPITCHDVVLEKNGEDLLREMRKFYAQSKRIEISYVK
jgi:hypothetical protein